MLDLTGRGKADGEPSGRNTCYNEVAMKSPFPGMDPYLERRWRDVHATLISYARELLNKQLPPDLAARTEDRVYVESGGESIRAIHPDVRVSEQQPLPEMTLPELSSVTVAQPIMIELDAEPVTEHFIEIIELDGERVVTAIEFISPTNKIPGDGRDAYLKKRREFIESRANLVEIDLVRSGDWVSLMRPYRVPAAHHTAYRACVRRASQPARAELYPIPLRSPLPTIPVPLRADDPLVTLNLQELLNRTYETGRYAGMNYGRECDPPFSAEDAVWADEILRNAGRR
jgi:hypothetical protein